MARKNASFGPIRSRFRAASRRLDGVGSHQKLVASVCTRYPGDLMRQIAIYLGEADISAGTGRRRHIAEDTLTAWGKIMFSVPAYLARAGCRIRDIKDMRRVHVVELVRLWVTDGLNAGTIQNRVAVLRRFLVLTGKPHAVPSGAPWFEILEEAGIDTSRLRRVRIPDVSKAWTERGVDPFEEIAAVTADCIICGTLLKVEHALGFRGKEGWCTKYALQDCGDYVKVREGAKAKRYREVYLSTDPERRQYQREVIELAKQVAATHGERGLLKIPGKTLVEMESHYHYIMRKHGLTKKGKGVTPHGLRHEYVGAELLEQSGLPPPVAEQAPADYYFADSKLQGAAIGHTSRQVGHGRHDVVGFYAGTKSKLRGATAARLKEWLSQLSSAWLAFEAASVSEAWIIGLAADGLPLREGRAMEIAVRLRSEAGREGSLEALRVVLQEAVKEAVSLLVWQSAGRPANGAEILLPG